jgi:uncharacterized protein (DUF1800 family)
MAEITRQPDAGQRRLYERPQILGDVALSPTRGEYRNMANNAKTDPIAGIAANANYAREIIQLMSIGTRPPELS